MGKLVKNIVIMGDKDSVRCDALFDTGASVSILRRDVAQKISSTFFPLKNIIKLKMVDGKKWVEVSNSVQAEIEMKDKILAYHFFIVDEMPRDAIIGVDFMQVWGIKLDLKREDYEVTVDPESLEMAQFIGSTSLEISGSGCQPHKQKVVEEVL